MLPSVRVKFVLSTHVFVDRLVPSSTKSRVSWKKPSGSDIMHKQGQLEWGGCLYPCCPAKWDA